MPNERDLVKRHCFFLRDPMASIRFPEVRHNFKDPKRLYYLTRHYSSGPYFGGEYNGMKFSMNLKGRSD